MKRIFQFKTLKARILSAFILLLTIVISFTSYTYISNTNMEKQAESLVQEDLIVLNASKNLALSMSVRLSATFNFISTGDIAHKETFNDYRAMAGEELNNQLQQFKV